jgi:peptidoglycan/xylan/chitin deacetylase (PgdA/CDA1 family)
MNSITRQWPVLVDVYRWSTTPIRWASLQWDRRRGTVPVAVLFYHRVEDHDPNPWTLSNQQFEQHVAWLEKRFEFVPLSEAQRRVAERFNDHPVVSLTFDDGYADNCAAALPLLLRKGIPFTYFVTLDNVLHGTPFPHDLARGKPLAPNSLESLRQLARAGVEIGGHSRTHADLGGMAAADRLFDEVITASQELASAVGAPVRYFAFPYGGRANISAQAVQWLKDHGFRGFCSAHGGLNRIGQDAFHIRRIHGDPHLAWLKNALTFDPRLRNAKWDNARSQSS